MTDWIRVTDWVKNRKNLYGWKEHFEAQRVKCMIKEKEWSKRKDMVYALFIQEDIDLTNPKGGG